MTVWISTKEAARRMGLEEATLRTWRSQQRGPRYTALSSRCIRYAENDVDSYVKARLVVPCEGISESRYAPR